MTGPCKKKMQKVAKGTCLSVVHTEVNKKLSQTVIKDYYDATTTDQKYTARRPKCLFKSIILKFVHHNLW